MIATLCLAPSLHTIDVHRLCLASSLRRKYVKQGLTNKKNPGHRLKEHKMTFKISTIYALSSLALPCPALPCPALSCFALTG